MDFTCRVEVLKQFLSRACLEKLVTDCLVQADTKNIFIKFCDNNMSLYGEVYEDQATIKDIGNLDISSTKKVLDVIGRIDLVEKGQKLVRVVSNDSQFVITDGSDAGSSNIKFTRAGVEYTESFQKIKDKHDLFDREKLIYAKKYQYANGFEVEYGYLTNLLKDAKAFGMDRYNFFEKDGILTCNIENVAIGDSFKRRLKTKAKIGQEISNVVVGSGFREIVNALGANDQDIIKIYFNDVSMLITDGLKFFYNLHTVEA